MRALVLGCGLPAECRGKYLDERAAVGGHLDLVLHCVAVGIAIARIGLRQARDRKPNAYGGQLQVGDGARPRLAIAKLDADAVLAFHGRKARDMQLILAAVALVQGHAGEVEAAVGVGQRGLIEEDRTHVVSQAQDLALADQIQDSREGCALQAVRRLN